MYDSIFVQLLQEKTLYTVTKALFRRKLRTGSVAFKYKANSYKSFYKTYGFLLFMNSGNVAGCLVGAFAPDFGGKI